MPSPSNAFRIVVLLVAAMIAAAGACDSARAQADVPATVIAVEAGTSKLVRLPQSASNIFVADPDIADVQAASGTALFVLGRRPGRTTVYALTGTDKVVLHADVRVGHGTLSLMEQLKSRFPQMPLSVSSAPNRLVIDGEVPTPSVADEVIAIANGFVKGEDKVINQLRVIGPTQVNLRVQVAEVSRTVTEEFGLNWGDGGSVISLFNGELLLTPFFGRDYLTEETDQTQRLFRRSATGAHSLFGRYTNKSGSVDISGVIDALDDRGLISILAQPTLVAMSGQTANFLAGGEFPIPIAQEDNKIEIEFKQFGVSLNFVPTVLAPDRISLKVRPEVSELNEAAGIEIEGLRIPGLSVRRVETTVELGSGQSFAIGGLLQNSSRSVVNKFPGIGNLPVLGELFTSRQFETNESELVIIVTPYVVSPIRSAAAIPQRGTQPNVETEALLRQRQSAMGIPVPDGARYYGAAGFIY